MITKFKHLINLPLVPVLVALLTGCADDTGLETGGGAGDLQPDPFAVSLVTPFVGMYQLPDNWSGNPPDDAFLSIEDPNEAGVAVAVLYDRDEINNCIPARPLEGEVIKEEVGNQVILENLLAFSSGILALDGTTLIIVFEDIFDIDPDNDWIEIRAPRVALMPLDLGPTC